MELNKELNEEPNLHLIGLKKIKSINELITMFPTEQSCIEYLEKCRWCGGGDAVISPYNCFSIVYKCKNGRYKCKETGYYFNVLKGTMLENTKVPLTKWFTAIWLVASHKKGISSLQLSRDIHVTQKTAWFMLQRIRKTMGQENATDKIYRGEVELDETFIGGKNKNRHASKKVANSQGRSCIDKTPVLGMVQRNGKLIAKKMQCTSEESITPLVLKHVMKETMVYSDEWIGYKKVSKKYHHLFVNHGSKQYVNGRIHTNTLEGAWSLLKRGIQGIYHSVSRKHLQRYVDEFVFRYNYRNMTDDVRFNYLLQSFYSCRLTYADLKANRR